MSGTSSLFWAGLMLVGILLFASSLEGPEPARGLEPPSMPAALAAPSPAGNGFAVREVERAADGHFYVEAQVNGARVRFLVDTGASVVALTAADAQRAGIAAGDERAQAIGAGGATQIAPVTIDRIAIGPLSANGVRGAIADELPVSLLGQSFLSRLRSVEIRGERMVLR